MQSLRNVLGVPSTKIPVDGTTFASYVAPPVVCYFVLAALAVTPRMRAARVALWPFTALLALRSMLSVDMSHSMPEYTFLDTMHVLFMCASAIRSLGWTLAKGPLVRYVRPKNHSRSTTIDALDLALALRGHGWEWSRGLYIPRETRPANPIAFVFCTLLSAIAHTAIFGILHRVVLTFVHERVGTSPEGSTLFDETLPVAVRYLRSSIITVIIALVIYAAMQLTYDVCTIIGILILGQDPAQWPPAFDAPWCATSLSDFWGRRWHQFFRHVFLFIGGYPLSLVLGRAGIVIGAFLASALWHHVFLLVLDSQADFRWNLFGFGMMAPGVLAERAFRQLTGKKVSGMIGWVWTMTWLILWGNVLFEGFARAPLHDRFTLIDVVPLVGDWVERLVTDLDGWLHDI